jgi:transcriptional regulator with XRE-family HTH domain
MSGMATPNRRPRPTPSDRPEATSDPGESERVRLGLRIRELRKSRGLTGRELARRIGVTGGLISQIECGYVMPSVATLLRMSKALDTHMGGFFEPPLPQTRLVRLADRNPYVMPDYNWCEAVISSDETGTLEVVCTKMEVGSSTCDELFTHGSISECVIVLSGELEVTVGADKYLMHAGDCITFPGSLPHGCRNPGSVASEHIWITSPVSY